jgi:ectoine hydroxylase-related dioxygenase (phytanoyl-CoA dioxygenase family)
VIFTLIVEVFMHTSDFREHGFVVVPGFLGGEEAAVLRRAADAILDRERARSRETGHTTQSVTLVGEDAEIVLAFLGSPRVCAVLFRAASVDTLRLKSASYYHEQTRHDWDGDWHRDSQFGRPDPEVERAVATATAQLHFRVALEDDDRLEIVPGSHARWDTDAELRIRRGARRTTAAMPGATRVVLQAGDACIFHASSIHRATYRMAPRRRTIDALYAL